MSFGQQNIRLLISYDGTDFSGWQRQRHDRTIQGEIERCLTLMTREEIHLHGAGRTDAGVHAEGMVAHFATGSPLSCHTFLRGLNGMLPGAIRILDAVQVSPDFHARFSAIGKRYQYIIYTGSILPPHLRLYSVHVTAKLDLSTINNCLPLLEGTHDFSSFENSGSRDKSNCSGRGAVRTIHQAKLIQQTPDMLIFQFIGDGFLRNMVRNLVGTLLDVGRKKLTVEEFSTILQAKDRTRAGATAPAHGLFLKEVLYGDLIFS
ncbi:tRNA pseudouridine(38-40) synthase TruA [Desulfopila sp. IMCC35006]|uniref:tRNA pseudouridine(38-40) synthase TruA n=1 Tax=Desulfopila sp. IMCC35006 TaxID=2569542 RepID=UPI0010AD66E8|nr:tRNA pseudouridine(38-40) synthase TruA [Desulfopila sp. IMCC35006]TKB23631.1 tRNA pseudouridine(38-40) synthase TruA [Desulfopila sp. IMCC35006]